MYVRTIAIGFIGAVLCLAGCDGGSNNGGSDAGKAAKSTSARSAALSARVVLPSRTVATGSTMAGEVVVTNNTGSAIDGIKCGSPFQLVLKNDAFEQASVWLGCAERYKIPLGESRYPVSIDASYRVCSPPACMNGRPPPIPTGTYTVLLAQNGAFVPEPPPFKVQVITA